MSGRQRRLRGAPGGLATLITVVGLLGCGGTRGAARPADFGWVDGTDPSSVGPKAPRVHWTRELTRHFEGRSVPVETAAAAIDSRTGTTFVGSSRGTLWALAKDGTELYRYAAGDAIDGPPALDDDSGELYLTSARGALHALDAASGKLRFSADVGASVSTPMLLSKDALYLVTDGDVVLALSRTDGSILWRYRRDPPNGLGIAGHAGLLLTERRLVTGFSDGAVVALDASDGSVAWELDTTLDVENPEDIGVFIDADATPVISGDTIYVASVASGVYALDARSGNLKQRFAELTGVTGLAVGEHSLIVSSSDAGVVCMDLVTHAVRWRKPPGRGAPSRGILVDGAVMVSETRGPLLALALDDGREIGRLESAHGFTTPPTVDAGQGAIVSNGGLVYSFSY